MYKCLRITLVGEPKQGFLQVIQKHARKNALEGIAQMVGEEGVKIIVCGNKEYIDDFVDLLHKESVKHNIDDIEIEPFLKDKDYRGVFRVIE